MAEARTKSCDICGKVMGESKDGSCPSPRHLEPSDGGMSMSFSAYFYGHEWEKNVPPDGDACSRACAVKMLRLALAYLDPDWRREMTEQGSLKKRKR